MLLHFLEKTILYIFCYLVLVTYDLFKINIKLHVHRLLAAVAAAFVQLCFPVMPNYGVTTSVL